jgi:integrase
MWTAALKRAKVRYRKPHQTRHTFATMMLMAGKIRCWLRNRWAYGCRSDLKRYAQWIASDMHSAASKAVALWSRVVTPAVQTS